MPKLSPLLSVVPLVLVALSAAPARAVIMTPQEAAAAGERACKPATGGMLDCIDIDTTPAAPANDPSIQPLPTMQYSGDQYPAASVEPPIRPALDEVPASLPSNRVTLGWDINFGTTAQYWEVWDNGELRMRSQTFTQRTLLTSKDSAAKAISVQSGVYTLTDMATGRHDLLVRLCNTGPDGEPACTPLHASTWVGAEKKDEKPSAPAIDWLPAVTTGEPVKIDWHLWWGTPGHYWQVLDQRKVLYESASFTEDTPNSQSAGTTISGLAPGKHVLSVRLCSKLACASSDPYPLEVVSTSPSPTMPQLAINSGTADSYILAWSLPLAAATNAPVSWQLLDADANAPLGGVQKQAAICNQGVVESRQSVVSTRSYCGQIRILRDQTPARVAVEVCFADDDCRASSPLVMATADVPPVSQVPVTADDTAASPKAAATATSATSADTGMSSQPAVNADKTTGASSTNSDDMDNKPFDLPSNLPAKNHDRY